MEHAWKVCVPQGTAGSNPAPSATNCWRIMVNMKLSWQRWVAAAAVVAMFAAGWAVYDQLPQQVASHWGINGQADDYSSRWWGAFLLPIMSAAVLLLLIVLPLIDPKRANIKKFIVSYDNFLLVFTLFFTYLYVLTLHYNLSEPFHMGQWMIPGLSVLFFVTGRLIQKAEYNYSIGIRTPWTLADKKIWNQTHALSGDIFKLAAIFMLAGMLFPAQSFWFVIGLIMVATLYSVGYSFYLYRKLHR